MEERRASGTMQIKYDLEVSPAVLHKNLTRIINLTYKLLPMREEGAEWKKPLETIIEEMTGLNSLLVDLQEDIFPIICKLEGLFYLTEERDFGLYRRVIFECLSLLNNVKHECIR